MEEFNCRKRARKIGDALSLWRWLQDAGSGPMPEVVDLTVFALFAEGCQNFGLGVHDLPARPFGIKISRTSLVDVIRATHDLPARLFAFPRI